jgi:hypothetical protein
MEVVHQLKFGNNKKDTIRVYNMNLVLDPEKIKKKIIKVDIPKNAPVVNDQDTNKYVFFNYEYLDYQGDSLLNRFIVKFINNFNIFFYMIGNNVFYDIFDVHVMGCYPMESSVLSFTRNIDVIRSSKIQSYFYTFLGLGVPESNDNLKNENQEMVSFLYYMLMKCITRLCFIITSIVVIPTLNIALFVQELIYYTFFKSGQDFFQSVCIVPIREIYENMNIMRSLFAFVFFMIRLLFISIFNCEKQYHYVFSMIYEKMSQKKFSMYFYKMIRSITDVIYEKKEYHCAISIPLKIASTSFTSVPVVKNKSARKMECVLQNDIMSNYFYFLSQLPNSNAFYREIRKYFEQYKKQIQNKNKPESIEKICKMYNITLNINKNTDNINIFYPAKNE